MSIPNPSTLFPQDIVSSNKMLIETSNQYIFAPDKEGGCRLYDDVIVFCIKDICIYWQNNSKSAKPDHKRVLRALLYIKQYVDLCTSIMHYDPTTKALYQYKGSDGIVRKWVIEFNDELCGGYGGASHNGLSWCAVSKNGIKSILDTAFQVKAVLPQVVLYELGRCCYDLVLDKILDWQLGNESEYGYWTLGFNGAMTVLGPEALGCDLNYAGKNLAQFRADRLKDLSTYVNNTQYTFKNTWSKMLLPWANNQSVNDLMSGLLIDLSDKYGGTKFLSRMFYRLKLEPTTPLKTDRERRANNLYNAVRHAVFDLYDDAVADSVIFYFRDKLRWSFVGSW